MQFPTQVDLLKTTWEKKAMRNCMPEDSELLSTVLDDSLPSVNLFEIVSKLVNSLVPTKGNSYDMDLADEFEAVIRRAIKKETAPKPKSLDGSADAATAAALELNAAPYLGNNIAEWVRTEMVRLNRTFGDDAFVEAEPKSLDAFVDKGFDDMKPRKFEIVQTSEYHEANVIFTEMEELELLNDTTSDTKVNFDFTSAKRSIELTGEFMKAVIMKAHKPKSHHFIFMFHRKKYFRPSH